MSPPRGIAVPRGLEGNRIIFVIIASAIFTVTGRWDFRPVLQIFLCYVEIDRQDRSQFEAVSARNKNVGKRPIPDSERVC